MKFDRREILAGMAATPAAAKAATTQLPQSGTGKAPDDERYWSSVAALYDVTRDVIQLENGNWGMMARPVLAAYQQHVERVNRETSYYARRSMGPELIAARARVAAALGVGADEIVFTRNATEALKGLIGGYNKLKAGDSILYADLDYDSMQSCMRSVAQMRGVTARRIALPEPASHQGLIDAYAAAFDADPKIRLVLLTHLSHRTGLVIPVREIIALARSRGIDAIVDSAHSWGQLDFSLPQIDADFVGFNLHKWWGAPLGAGVMYIRKSRLDAIDHDLANDPHEEGRAERVDARAHTGTVDFASLLTVPQALDFQAAIGAPARAARLRYLRDRWVKAVRGLDGIDVLTPDDPRLHGSITSFRIRGLTTADDNIRVTKALLDQHGIFTVHRTGVEKGACVRVTPALFNSPEQVDRLAKALIEIVPQMRR
jgi:selenocysteine lyase/cysteine desulfurase